MPLDPRQLAEIESLTRAQRRAWEIIARHARETGKRCFTYTTIFKAWKKYSDLPIRLQTLDRRLRELAEKGILEKRKDGRTTVFCLRSDLYDALTS